MDDRLEIWVEECIRNGTFESRADAIEFCVGATRFAEGSAGITQKTLVAESYGGFPLRWSEEIDKILRKVPPISENKTEILGHGTV